MSQEMEKNKRMKGRDVNGEKRMPIKSRWRRVKAMKGTEKTR
jgi:hypothetical protein